MITKIDIEKFIKKLEVKMPKGYAIGFSIGVKFARVFHTLGSPEHPQRSCWGFLDLSNGDVLKSAGWNRPAKHPRGNIFEDNIMDKVEWTGPRSLK
jgi:hypothetical protein